MVFKKNQLVNDSHPSWQLNEPVTAIVFDCDGTLSRIEGINELARMNHVASPIRTMTDLAMGSSGLNPELYKKRLQLVSPKKDQLTDLGKMYFQKLVPDAASVIKIFKRFNKSIYIVSAGLFPAVAQLGAQLDIPKENIFAVDLKFDNQGHYITFDDSSPLVHHEGKRHVIEQIKQTHPRVIHIGDGSNDCSVYDLVVRLIGYGGIFYREAIVSLFHYYIRTVSLAPLLALSLTPHEQMQLLDEENHLYQKGLSEIMSGKVSNGVI